MSSESVTGKRGLKEWGTQIWPVRKILYQDELQNIEKYWGQEEKGMTEDEMAGWHHRLDGRESEWTPGVGDGQGGLACCDSWGWKESDTTERLNWTELMQAVNDEEVGSLLLWDFFHFYKVTWPWKLEFSWTKSLWHEYCKDLKVCNLKEDCNCV